MARIWTAGAESADLNQNGIERVASFGAAASTIVSAAARSGLLGWRCASGAGNATSFISSNVGQSGVIYARAYLRFTDLPASTVIVMRFGTGTATFYYSARLTSLGKLQLFEDTGGTQVGSDSAATIVTGQWYRIEMFHSSYLNTPDSVELRLDGVTVASQTAEVQSTAPVAFQVGWIDAPGANKTLDIDDMCMNDDSGADQNTWPGDGNVVLLLPTSDNARAALWTGGAGGTTNLFDAVDNTPPVGTATETNTTQIEHAGGAAGSTDAYDANMTTYTAAGVGATDTITLVQLIAVHGEDIATGTKLLAFSIVSNPAVASSGNVTAGNDAGALGTYPTNWTIHRGTVSYAPTVTKGTAPVMRALRPETATRVASVCFMGILVEYVPPVAAGRPMTFDDGRTFNRGMAFSGGMR